jgi:histidyl-tRNA synthetase
MGRKKMTSQDKARKTTSGNRNRKVVIANKSFDKNLFRLLGTKDIIHSDEKFFRSIVKKIDETAECYSFDRIDTPILEDFNFYKKLFDKNKLKNIFPVESRNNTEKIILRPDLVHSTIRIAMEYGNLNILEKPLKFFSMGPVFRQEKVKGGSYRQFNQFNFSIINDAKPITDAFLIFLVYNIFKELQIDVQVQVNSLGGVDCQKEFLHKFNKFIKEKGRRTKLCAECKKNILKDPALLLECQEDECQKVRSEMPQIIDFLSEESNARFYKTMDFLDKMEVNYNFNPYLTRDLSYYNDLIFEIWPIDKNGEVNPKLALGRGGRYDRVFSRLAGKDISFIGFSGGLERTMIKAKESTSFIDDNKDVIFLTQIDIQSKSKAMFLFKELLSKGFNVKQAFHLDGLKEQLEEARNLKSKIILILGKKELAEETILFRDMESGVQEIIAQKDLIGRLEKGLSQ